MQAVVSIRDRVPDLSPSGKRGLKSKACHLSFYKTPPDQEIELDDLEEYAIARLQVLRRIDVLRAQGITGEKFVAGIVKADNKYLFPTNSKTYIEDRKRDLISHYVLRMAYCKTEELRRWLLSNESQLFAIRLANTKASEVDQFLVQHGIQYPPISKAEKSKLKTNLMASDGNMSMTQYESMEFYKVPFTEVSNLVAKRKVFLQGGFAYVSRDKVSSIVLERFRASLSKSLTVACQKSELMERDGRIEPLVDNLAKIAFRYGGSLVTASTGLDGAVNSESVIGIFKNYLTTTMGHTEPKVKPFGGNKMFVNVGTRKPNERDRTCPIAGRCHKSNTQKYTIFFDTQVMMQGCWDGVCQATNRHVFYQIHEGKCVKVGWEPPPVLALENKSLSESNKKGSK